MRVVTSNLPVLMAKKGIKSISELKRGTGLNRLTLTKMYNDETTMMDFNTTVRLCKFFECKIGDLYQLIDKDVKMEQMKKLEEDKSRNRKGHVYFFNDLNTGLTKVGKTINIEKRLNQLQNEFDTELELIGSLPSDQAFQLEKKIHASIDEYRVNGEWFSIPKEKIKMIIEEETK